MTQINQIQKKKLVMQTGIPNTSGLVKKRDYNAKITEIESKIHSISGLATTYVLNAVENKIPDVSTLTKKTDYGWKISNIESKHVATADYNKFAKLRCCW